MGDELEHIVVVGQAAGGRRQAEETVLGQHHILRPDTQLEILPKKEKASTLICDFIGNDFVKATYSIHRIRKSSLSPVIF